MSDKKPVQVEKEIDLVQPRTGGTPDKAQDELRLPIGADQGFVYYEE